MARTALSFPLSHNFDSSAMKQNRIADAWAMPQFCILMRNRKLISILNHISNETKSKPLHAKSHTINHNKRWLNKSYKINFNLSSLLRNKLKKRKNLSHSRSGRSKIPSRYSFPALRYEVEYVIERKFRAKKNLLMNFAVVEDREIFATFNTGINCPKSRHSVPIWHSIEREIITSMDWPRTLVNLFVGSL